MLLLGVLSVVTIVTLDGTAGADVSAPQGPAHQVPKAAAAGREERG